MVWAPILRPLSAAHAVLAPTLPGHYGASARLDRAAGLSALLDALEAELDAAGIETAHLAGNSLGGRLALELARRGRARSVVCFSPAAACRSRLDTTRPRLALRLALGIARRRRLATRRTARRLMTAYAVAHPDRLSDAEVERWRRALAGCHAASALLDDLKRTPSIAPLAGCGCPITLAWPERDRVIPFARFGAPLLDLVPHARHVQLAGVGHVPMSDDPSRVTRTILQATRAAERLS